MIADDNVIVFLNCEIFIRSYGQEPNVSVDQEIKGRALNEGCIWKVLLGVVCKYHDLAIAKRWERFSLSAFGRGRGAKWGCLPLWPGRGEVPRFTISSKALANS